MIVHPAAAADSKVAPLQGLDLVACCEQDEKRVQKVGMLAHL